MSVVRLVAGCKVNLGLRVTGRRPDGYHELDSLFWPLPEPCDILELHPRQQGGLKVVCPTEGIDPTHNTLTRTWAAFAEATGQVSSQPPGLEVHLLKGIPHGAGLGGGSSDAAALLRWLNAQLPNPLPEEDLARLAVRIGADTPFFLQDSPCIVQGIGEVLTPVSPQFSDLWLTLVCPDIHISTPWAFQELDRLAPHAALPPPENSLTKPASGANGNSLSGAGVVEGMHNDLEEAVFPRYPRLAEIKGQLLHHGAIAAVMSGSGSSMLGLFSNAAAAGEACSTLGKAHGRAWCLPLACTGM